MNSGKQQIKGNITDPRRRFLVQTTVSNVPGPISYNHSFLLSITQSTSEKFKFLKISFKEAEKYSTHVSQKTTVLCSLKMRKTKFQSKFSQQKFVWVAYNSSQFGLLIRSVKQV